MSLVLVHTQTPGAGVQLNGPRPLRCGNMMQCKSLVRRAGVAAATGASVECGMVVRGSLGRDWTEKAQRCVGVLVGGFDGICFYYILICKCSYGVLVGR